MSRLTISYNSFQRWKTTGTLINLNIKKLFNFYFIFYFFSFFSKLIIYTIKKCKKKIVVLKSPFHFKIAKHHIMYKFYLIKCNIITFYKYIFLIKYILINYLYFNKSVTSTYTVKKKLIINNFINIILVSQFFSFYLPFLSFFIFSIWITVYFFWWQYNRYSKYLHPLITDYSKFDTGNLFGFFFKLVKIFVITILFYLIFILKIYDYEYKLINLSNIVLFQFKIFSIFYIFALYLFSNKIFDIKSLSIDFCVFLIILYITCFILFISINFLNLFVVLEVLNLLIIYSFITTFKYNTLIFKIIVNKSFWLINTLIYQFILNFFSSIIFYFSFNLLISNTFSSSFFFLKYFNFDYGNISIFFFFTYLSFLIKFGIGPWIFYKLEIYKNFNFILLILYSIVYFLVLLIFFFNLFFIYGLPITFFQTLIFGILIILAVISLFVYLYSYFNIYIFFSFSSLINLSLVFFQWISYLFFFTK